MMKRIPFSIGPKGGEASPVVSQNQWQVPTKRRLTVSVLQGDKVIVTIRKKGVAKKPANPTDKYVGSRVRMRRMMLAVSQTDLADQLGLIFQQVQKYENGTNRISASRLQQSAHILQVPVTFFFEGAPSVPGAARRVQGMAPSPAYVTDFLATWDGLRLTKAFMRIESTKLRRQIVNLVREIAPDDRN